MNRILLFMVSVVCFSIISCDDDHKQIQEPKPVTGLTYEAGPGNVLLKWAAPETEGVSYIEIVYKSDDETAKKVLVFGQATEKLIYGFANEKLYTFTVTVYMQDGSKSAPQTIQAAPEKPAFIDLQSTIEISNNFGGIDLKWNNLSGDKFYINVQYTTGEGELQDAEIDVLEEGAGKQFVSITGVLNADVNVSVSDIVGNTTAPLVYYFKNLEKGKFDRSIWEIPDFSSQEAVGEDGKALNLLDGNKTTFWHSKWYDADASLKKFPHYVTFDLKRTVKISKVEITQRHNKIMANKVIIYGSNNSYSGPWTEMVTITLPQTQGATLVTPLATPVEFRFVKMFLETPGSQDTQFGALAEFALYGEDIVEE